MDETPQAPAPQQVKATQPTPEEIKFTIDVHANDGAIVRTWMHCTRVQWVGPTFSVLAFTLPTGKRVTVRGEALMTSTEE